MYLIYFLQCRANSVAIFQGFEGVCSSGSSKAKLGFESREPEVESAPKDDSAQTSAKAGEPVKGSQQTLFSNLPSNAWDSRRTLHTGNGLWPMMSRKLYSTAPSSSGSGKKRKPIATEFKSEVNNEN